MLETLSLSDRSARLEAAIRDYVRDGYRVVSRTETTAQLVKPKRFNAVLAILGALLLLIGLVIYLLAYLGQSERTVYLEVDEQGTVRETTPGRTLRCANCGHISGGSRVTCKACGKAL